MGISGRMPGSGLQGEGQAQMLWEQYTSTYIRPQPLTDLDILGETRHLSPVDFLIHL